MLRLFDADAAYTVSEYRNGVSMIHETDPALRFRFSSAFGS